MVMVIGRHLGTIAATAKDDAKRIFTLFDSRSQRMDHIRIIDTFIAVGTVIFDLVTGFFQFFNQKLLHFKAAMVARYGYDLFHFYAVDISMGKITYFHCSQPFYKAISERLNRFEKINGFKIIS